MKGFFLSLFFLTTSLLQVCLAQQASLVIEADTIELGQALSIRIEQGTFSPNQSNNLGPWEIFSQTETTIEVLNFTTGLHRLPVFSYEKTNKNTDTISVNQLIVVRLPATVKESESVRAIASPVTIPSTWRDWAPQITAISGALLWALIWLLATIKQYGPAEKRLPPTTARAQALVDLAHLNKENPATIISEAQQVFRNYLAGIGMKNARTIPAGEFRQLLEESAIEKESFREIVSKIENLDSLRFSGISVSTQDAHNFFLLIQQFIDQQPVDSKKTSPEYISKYGRQASGVTRILSGCLDLIPPALVFSGLLMWPGFAESVSAPTIFSGPIMVCLTGISAALLIRTITAWMTVSGPWQATPGMRLMKLAVVGKVQVHALRPLFWLLASLPFFIGHIGVFSRSGQSFIDTFMSQRVRQYPRETVKK